MTRMTKAHELLERTFLGLPANRRPFLALKPDGRRKLIWAEDSVAAVAEAQRLGIPLIAMTGE